jgi:hypothetical protein
MKEMKPQLGVQVFQLCVHVFYSWTFAPLDLTQSSGEKL